MAPIAGSGASGSSSLYKVWEIRALKRQKRSDEARSLLERVAKQVEPIMARRKWKVPLLSEFSPSNARLLGLNINRGREIRIRLRPAGKPDSFFPYEHVLGTMLHELTHIERGPHDAKFYKLLDELNEECDDLIARGITGTPFVGSGHRLGSSAYPSIRPAAAMAAERRMRDDVWCGGGCESKGGKGEDGGNRGQGGAREKEEEEWESAREVGEGVDGPQQRANDGRPDGRDDGRGGMAVGEGHGGAVGPGLEGDERGEGRGRAGGARKRPRGAEEHNCRSRKVISGSGNAAAGGAAGGVKCTGQSTGVTGGFTREDAAGGEERASGEDTWTCHVCTLINRGIVLQCEACLAVRPSPGPIHRGASATAAGTSASVAILIDDNPTAVNIAGAGAATDSADMGPMWACHSLSISYDPEVEESTGSFSVSQLPFLESLQLEGELVHRTHAAASEFHVSDPASEPEYILLPQSFQPARQLRPLICPEKIGAAQMSLTNLPDSFGHLGSLKKITMYMLPLTELPESFPYLSSLKSLLMVGCREIRQLPANFGRLGALKTLCMVKQSELKLPVGLGGMAAIRRIFPGEVFNQMQLPGSLTQLASLTRLDLDFSLDENLDEGMGRLNQLRQLHIQCCFNLREVPYSVTELTNLDTLTIGLCSQLVSLPDRLDALFNLKRLEIIGCHHDLWLNRPPISLPSSLESLSLGNYNQTILLPDLPTLPNLKKLTLNLVNVEGGKSLTSALPRLQHLELVLAEDTEQLAFPLASLPQLRILEISRAGNIEKLPGSIGADLKQLRHLQIENAPELNELPELISQLRHLTSLDVHAPKLASLPTSIGALSRLKELAIFDCTALESLPASFTQLACLNKLNLGNTGIRSLPGNFAQLTRLKSLDLYRCARLESLPEDFSELEMLQFFRFGGCTDELDEEREREFRACRMYGVTIQRY
ncbi:unnamed protein product [Closterium sp. Yama58-4]|nr:unnamed protein product [Closterium sp. Yama58-4]